MLYKFHYQDFLSVFFVNLIVNLVSVSLSPFLFRFSLTGISSLPVPRILFWFWRNADSFVYVSMFLNNRNFLTDQFFDGNQIRSFYGVTKRKCNSTRFCSSRSSDAMHIGFRYVWKVVVDHQSEVGHVNSTCSNVCCD